MMNESRSETDEYSFMVAPSPISGVGVFAVHDIPKNTILRVFGDEETRFIPHKKAAQEPEHVQHFYKWFCIVGKDGYDCPVDFGKMEIGWYLNHSKTPNAYHRNYFYYALRDIKKGEEILIDYESLDEHPQTINAFKP